MGYAMLLAPCYSCGRTFTSNPIKVPSIRVDGVKQPVCRPCVEWANVKREEMGLEPHHIHREAYEPADENEL